MIQEINLPRVNWYRRVVTKAKAIHQLSVVFKFLNVGRLLEISRIVERAELKDTDVLCDIGCGDGFWSNRFRTSVSRVFAFDPFEDDLEKAKRYSSDHLLFFNGIGEAIPLPSESCDKVISICVFEHCFDDQRVFAEIFRVLRPDGKLLATIDSLDSPFVRDTHKKWHMTNCYCSQLYTEEAIRTKLFDAGFTSVSTSYLMGSRVAVYWEILTERLGASMALLSPLVMPLIFILERKKNASGYKILVEAQK